MHRGIGRLRDVRAELQPAGFLGAFEQFGQAWFKEWCFAGRKAFDLPRVGVDANDGVSEFGHACCVYGSQVAASDDADLHAATVPARDRLWGQYSNFSQEPTVVRVIVDVMPKPEILDPQGKAVLGALPRLGFGGVSDVRQGKRFELEVESADDATLAEVTKIAETLLSNPVIEDFTVRVDA